MLVTPYKIYSASAGSGKTYILVKEYLRIILSPGFNNNFRQLLAITFTNKAVNEMKQRILERLFQFSQTSAPEKAGPLFRELVNELRITPEELTNKARDTLKQILHNYAFFDISTIDKFTHRLIRTFARDLKLPQNFEVILDTDLLLEEAVNQLISNAGTNDKLTEVLIEFALEKIEDAKSWDVSRDLINIGKLLFSENHVTHLKAIKTKDINDFLALKRELRSAIEVSKQNVQKKATEALEFISECGLEHSDFPRETLPNHFKKIQSGSIEPISLYNNKLEENLSEGKIVKAGINLPSADIAILLHEKYLHIKDIIYRIAFLKNAYKNSVPLTILNAIQKEITTLEQERNQLPISSFNSIISDEIKNQPAPFIYERIGEKYRHYFIDEFQDTSEMQWNNLIPLISNALESENEQGQRGSLFLVGDAKQAIYRWRGGRTEQFLNLISKANQPFVVPPAINNLPINYRSKNEIVRFNNDFFTATASYLNSEGYQTLFKEGNRQKSKATAGGFVHLSFLEEYEDRSLNEVYCQRVLQTIREVTADSFDFRDICILTRKSKHGVLLSDFLMQEQIPLISSETLLLSQNNKVTFLINILRHCIQPEALEICYEILFFLVDKEVDRHAVISENILCLRAFLISTYSFDFDHLKQLSVYDGLEYAIRQFGLAAPSDAYLSFLLDEVLTIEKQEDTGISTFLNYWDKKKDKLSIVAPDHMNAVRIMTIHKAKGLEFPVVIFPFANTYIYDERNPKLWLPFENSEGVNFKEILISKKKEVLQYGEKAADVYLEEQYKLELDAFNVLYVALTRAIDALYIFTENDTDTKGAYKAEYFSGLFQFYLKNCGKWKENITSYEFGALPQTDIKKNTPNSEFLIPYQYTYKNRPGFRILTTSGQLWDSDREVALARGTAIHRLMEVVITADDLELGLKNIENQGLPAAEVAQYRKITEDILDHPQLKSFYQEGNLVKNECDIITQNGLILRPDRLVFNGKKVAILDYKTGKKSPKYQHQLYAYADALEEMGYQIEYKVIIYIDKTIKPEFI